MKRSGFTLIELLAVLGIIGVLAAVLFPVFAQTRKNAQRTACQSNLRQVGLAIHQYVQDNDSKYPLMSAGSATSGYYWWSDAISPYLKSRETLWCPSVARRQANYPNWDSGYIYNWVNRLETFDSPLRNEGRERGVHEAKFVNLANTIIVYDGVSDGDTQYNHSVKVPNCRSINFHGKPVTALDYPALHFGGSNFLFGDGHVKWHMPETAAQIECSESP